MTTSTLLREVLRGLELPTKIGTLLKIHGAGTLAARYPVSDLACATLGAAALSVAHWIDPRNPPAVRLDRALASWWFGYSLSPEGWTLPRVRAAMTGDYQASDGWIRIHANAPHHRLRAQAVLGIGDTASRPEVEKRVAQWPAQALENAMIAQGACAAVLRRPQDWAHQAQGIAVAAEPLIHHTHGSDTAQARLVVLDSLRPLAGLRVLDLTRVLAGPTATRFLAAYGAQVLRLDPVSWTEPGMVPEVTVGKRCALLDLRSAEGLCRFKALLAQADVLVHGYRPGALDRLGLDAATRQALRPGLVDVSLSAWGWSGPWQTRRGFDSLVQMSTGIAWGGNDDAAPSPLPVQALDQATGYLMAACALQGLAQARRTGRGSQWQVSLARTALLLQTADHTEPGPDSTQPALGAAPQSAYDPTVETTAWGPAHRLLPPCSVGNASWRWDRGAVDLRGDEARFTSDVSVG